MSKTILFFGNERLATGVSTTAPVLRGLLADGYHVAAVITQYDQQASRRPRAPEIIAVAEAHNIPVLLPKKPVEIIDQLAAFTADAAVLVAYGKIVPQAVIDIFPKGIINIHPSALPEHRGPTPLESVIMSGASSTAVSLMQLTAGMDSGPVYAQQSVPLTGNETKQELADNLLAVGASMVHELLPSILDGSLAPTPQDDSHATYDQLLRKEDSQLDWSRPAIELARMVRAYAVWPRSRAHLAGHDIIITKAHAIEGNGTPGSIADIAGLGIHTGDGVLVLDEVLPPGKKPMNGADFARGHLSR